MNKCIVYISVDVSVYIVCASHLRKASVRLEVRVLLPSDLPLSPLNLTLQYFRRILRPKAGAEGNWSAATAVPPVLVVLQLAVDEGGLQPNEPEGGGVIPYDPGVVEDHTLGEVSSERTCGVHIEKGFAGRGRGSGGGNKVCVMDVLGKEAGGTPGMGEGYSNRGELENVLQRTEARSNEERML